MAEKSSKEKSPSSHPPSSQAPPPGGSSGGSMIYVVGVLVLGGAIAALLWYRSRGEEPEPKPQAQATAPAPEPDLPEFSPPPPPEDDGEDEEEDAEDGDEKEEAPKTETAGRTGGGSCSNCGGDQARAGGALRTAVAQTAGLARGCYDRTLRSGGSEGQMMVSVSVGSAGNLCGANIVSDSVGNPTLSQCVVGKFKSRSYPKPEKGCVVVNVPISFKVKQ